MSSSKCKDCRYCNHGKFNRGQWYCNSPKVSIFELPVDAPYQKEEQKKPYDEKKCSHSRIIAAAADSDCNYGCDMQCPYDTAGEPEKNKECESCFYYGRPSDAPETTEEECMYIPTEDYDYTPPCERVVAVEKGE